jgi:hypothetical protein
MKEEAGRTTHAADQKHQKEVGKTAIATVAAAAIMIAIMTVTTTVIMIIAEAAVPVAVGADTVAGSVIQKPTQRQQKEVGKAAAMMAEAGAGLHTTVTMIAIIAEAAAHAVMVAAMVAGLVILKAMLKRLKEVGKTAVTMAAAGAGPHTTAMMTAITAEAAAPAAAEEARAMGAGSATRRVTLKQLKEDGKTVAAADVPAAADPTGMMTATIAAAAVPAVADGTRVMAAGLGIRKVILKRPKKVGCTVATAEAGHPTTNPYSELLICIMSFKRGCTVLAASFFGLITTLSKREGARHFCKMKGVVARELFSA